MSLVSYKCIPKLHETLASRQTLSDKYRLLCGGILSIYQGRLDSHLIWASLTMQIKCKLYSLGISDVSEFFKPSDSCKAWQARAFSGGISVNSKQILGHTMGVLWVLNFSDRREHSCKLGYSRDLPPKDKLHHKLAKKMWTSYDWSGYILWELCHNNNLQFWTARSSKFQKFHCQIQTQAFVRWAWPICL